MRLLSQFSIFQVSDEIKITHEDQKMINAFANKNAKHNELKNTVEKNKVKFIQIECTDLHRYTIHLHYILDDEKDLEAVYVYCCFYIFRKNVVAFIRSLFVLCAYRAHWFILGSNITSTSNNTNNKLYKKATRFLRNT